MRVPIAIENCRFVPVEIHDGVTLGDLTTGKPGLKYVKFRRNMPSASICLETLRIYDLKVDLSSKP